MSQASGSFLKKRTKKLLLTGGSFPGGDTARRIKNSFFAIRLSPRTTSTVMARLDRAIHAFTAAKASNKLFASLIEEHTPSLYSQKEALSYLPKSSQ